MRTQRVQYGEQAWCPTQPAQPMRQAEILTCVCAPNFLLQTSSSFKFNTRVPHMCSTNGRYSCLQKPSKLVELCMSLASCR
jgi:hypothetical protein